MMRRRERERAGTFGGEQKERGVEYVLGEERQAAK